tara:strand:+ start:63 stop:218 length:156 start_codon:yes stop_codon:yes gene_type:complete
MRKDDWLKLAMPASICLLAASIITMPLVSNAFPTSIEVTQAWGDSWEMSCD